MVYCGLLTAGDAYQFVTVRASAMHACTLKNPGTMLAVIGLSNEQVIQICHDIPGANPANFNGPNQVVIACTLESLSACIESVALHNGKAIRLAVSGAFHGPLMDNASAKLQQYLENVTFSEMKIPLYANATARVYDDPKTLLAQQVNNPVRWMETIENMIEDGFDTFIETGPGKTLTGLIKKISKEVKTYNVYDIETLNTVATALSGRNNLSTCAIGKV